MIWAPGNHDLWTPRTLEPGKRGVAHYERLVALCRSFRRPDPGSPYAKWPGDGPARAIVPTFVLFDYSFRPPNVARDSAIAWASATGVRSAERDLLADPYPTVTPGAPLVA